MDEARRKFGNRHLTNADDVFQHNAWDNVEWDEELQAQADEKVAANSAVHVNSEQIQEYEDKADHYWNKFYETHERNFFKDRHWLFTEFTELLGSNRQDTGTDSSFKIFEIGCGVGNTIFPILQMNLDTQFFVYGCDFSDVAINLLKSEPVYDESRCCAFVLDATSENWEMPFEKESIDVVLLIFTLSAINPSKAQNVLSKIFVYLKPGGLVLFRDYGRHDMAQLRFKTGHCLGNNFYVRGDGTRAYFFTQEELHEMFTSVGLEKKEMFVDRRLQVNRGKKLHMYRIWIQAKYQKPLQSPNIKPITC